jgi:hypothetical protein
MVYLCISTLQYAGAVLRLIRDDPTALDGYTSNAIVLVGRVLEPRGAS